MDIYYRIVFIELELILLYCCADYIFPDFERDLRIRELIGDRTSILKIIETPGSKKMSTKQGYYGRKHNIMADNE